MPTYMGNRGNLLQHWVLAELVDYLLHNFSSRELCFVDAHAMSPFAVRSQSPGASASAFDTVKNLLPGRGSAYEVAWKELREVADIEYPSSAALVRQLWPGSLRCILCEADMDTADEIDRWIESIRPTGAQCDLRRGDWRVGFGLGALEGAGVYLGSFDPNRFDLSGPRNAPNPALLYPSDLEIVGRVFSSLKGAPTLVQISTYSAIKGNKQVAVSRCAKEHLARFGLDLLDTVTAGGSMMSLVFGRDLPEPWSCDLGARFGFWDSSIES